MIMRFPLCLLLVAALGAAEGRAETFTGQAGEDPDGAWGAGSIALVDGRSVLRLESGGEGAQCHLRWELPPGAAEVTVALRARARELHGLNPPKQAPKLLIAREDEARKPIGWSVIAIPTDGAWHELHATLAVAGAHSLKLSPGLYDCGGILEVDVVAMAPGAEPPELPADPRVRAVPELDEPRIDVTAPPFDADPSGRRDTTADLQLAFAAARRAFESGRFGRRVITVHLPAGTYLVSDTLSFGSGEPEHLHVTGAGVDATEVRLVDAAPGFAGDPKPVIAFCETGGRYWQSNVSFNNAVRDLTVSVGAGNPGAVGIDYHNNNTGSIRDVRIRSLDPEGAGHTGLRMPGGLSGIGLMQDITIEGFRFGVHARDRKIGYVFERLTLKGQTEAGVVSHDKPLWIRHLVSDNAVPAVVGATGDSHLVLLESELRGGAADTAAVVTAGHCFLRDVAVVGYGHAVDDRGTLVPTATIDEYVGGSEPLVLGTGPARSLGLAVEDPPAIPAGDPATWVRIDGDAQDDDSAAIQQAIDGGAEVVVLDGDYTLSQPILVRGGLRILRGGMPGGIGSQVAHGLHAGRGFPAGEPLIRITEQAAPELLLDSLNTAHHAVVLENRSPGTVVIRDMSAGPYRGYGSGRVFFEGCVGGYGTGAYEMVPHPFVVLRGQRAWFRHYNPEGSFPHLVNDGGEVVVIGAKFGEWHGPYVVNAGGGRTEILGALFNSIETQPKPQRAMVRNDGGEIALVVADDQKVERQPHPFALRQAMIDGEERIAYQALPDRGERRILGLVVGRSDLPTPAADAPVATAVLVDDAPVAPGGVARVRVILDRPAPEPLEVRLILGSPSTVDQSVFGGTLPRLAIPAGTSEAGLELPIAAHPARTQLVVLRVSGGLGYRTDPIAPGAHLVLHGRGVELDDGLACRVVPGDDGPVEASGRDQELHPKNLALDRVDGRRALVFGLNGSELRLGTVGQGYRGFMHQGFRERSFTVWVHADGEARTLLREGGGYGGMSLDLREGTLRLAHATGNTLHHVIEAPWPRERTWRHVAAVFSHGRMELYLDGDLVAADRTATYDTGRHSASGGLGVGGLRAAIAEARIYERALTPAEVAALAASP